MEVNPQYTNQSVSTNVLDFAKVALDAAGVHDYVYRGYQSFPEVNFKFGGEDYMAEIKIYDGKREGETNPEFAAKIDIKNHDNVIDYIEVGDTSRWMCRDGVLDTASVHSTDGKNVYSLLFETSSNSSQGNFNIVNLTKQEVIKLPNGNIIPLSQKSLSVSNEDLLSGFDFPIPSNFLIDNYYGMGKPYFESFGIKNENYFIDITKGPESIFSEVERRVGRY